MNQQLRKTDNGVRKYISPGWIMVVLLIATIIASIKSIPALRKDVSRLKSDVVILDTNYKWILKGIDELKILIKEKSHVK